MSKFIVLIEPRGADFNLRMRKALASAIQTAIKHALENDIAGAEALNRQDCDAVRVEPASTTP